ncbi:hypothetical protein P9112_012744 [Eukaryota sp. TZLM1-RC]
MAAHHHTKSMASAFKTYNERERFSSAQEASRSKAFKEERVRAARRLIGREAAKEAEQTDSFDLAKYKPWYASTSQPSPSAPPSSAGRKRTTCQNCGGNGHATRDCLEKPRIRKQTFEQQTDRFQGYDPRSYRKVIDNWSESSFQERLNKQKQLMSSFLTEPDPEQVRFPHSTVKFDKRQREKEAESEGKIRGAKEVDDLRGFLPTTSRRSLGERAKFLDDLEGESSYDPKTRSIELGGGEEGLSFESCFDEGKSEMFAWERREVEKGESREAKESMDELRRLKEMVKEEREKVKKEKKSEEVKSRWDEENEGGHSSAWGSYFKQGKWGYQCCKQTNKDSVCLKEMNKYSIGGLVV